jgi:hypothetical protein
MVVLLSTYYCRWIKIFSFFVLFFLFRTHFVPLLELDGNGKSRTNLFQAFCFKTGGLHALSSSAGLHLPGHRNADVKKKKSGCFDRVKPHRTTPHHTALRTWTRTWTRTWMRRTSPPGRSPAAAQMDFVPAEKSAKWCPGRPGRSPAARTLSSPHRLDKVQASTTKRCG